MHVRTYGGKTDEDLCQKTAHTGTTQKWVNLLDEVLHDYKGKGHCVTMDSAYMGNILAQVGHYEWQINMVGTAQVNRTGAEAKEIVKKMKVGTYESKIFQHKTKPLCFKAWSDNNIVKTLSNFHLPTILNAKKGVWRKKRGPDKKREQS